MMSMHMRVMGIMMTMMCSCGHTHSLFQKQHNFFHDILGLVIMLLSIEVKLVSIWYFPFLWRHFSEHIDAHSLYYILYPLSMILTEINCHSQL